MGDITPSNYRVIYRTPSIDISTLNHSEIGVICTDLAIKRGHHLVEMEHFTGNFGRKMEDFLW